MTQDPLPPTVSFWPAFVAEPIARVHAENRAYLASEAAGRADGKTITVLVTAALALTIQRYVGAGDRLLALIQGLSPFGGGGIVRGLEQFFAEGPEAQFHRLLWWAAISMVTYVILPASIIRLGFRERLRDYGTKPGGAFADAWFYGLLFAVAGPLIVLFSAERSFQETYPFYEPRPEESLWPRFWIWEAVYFLQFFGVEFFFRGFLVHGLKHRFGIYSIFVMMVPYCMLHHLKPLPECLASILGGIVLGFMSIRTRSIWMGTAIHIAVAATMDFSSLWRQGRFS